jgi:hypothetical protein
VLKAARDALTPDHLPYVLILEEDAMITTENLLEKMFACLSRLPSWHIFFLGYNTMGGELYHRTILRVWQTYTGHAYVVNKNQLDRFNSDLAAWDKPIDVYYAEHITRQRQCYGIYPIAVHQRPGFSSIEKTLVNYVELCNSRAAEIAKRCSAMMLKECVLLQPPAKKHWKTASLSAILRQYAQINLDDKSGGYFDYVIVLEKGCTQRLNDNPELTDEQNRILSTDPTWDVLVLSEFSLERRAYAVRKTVWDKVGLWQQDNDKLAMVHVLYPPVYGMDTEYARLTHKGTWPPATPPIAIPYAAGAFPLATRYAEALPLSNIITYTQIVVFYTNEKMETLTIEGSFLNHATRFIKQTREQMPPEYKKTLFVLMCQMTANGDKTQMYKQTQFANVVIADTSLYANVPRHTVVFNSYHLLIYQTITRLANRMLIWRVAVPHEEFLYQKGEKPYPVNGDGKGLTKECDYLGSVASYLGKRVTDWNGEATSLIA